MENSANYPYSIGETVVYRKQGIYVVSEIKEQEIGAVKKNYYVLSSVYDKNTSVYVPVDNEVLTARMEHVLSEEEIHRIIDVSEESSIQWIDNAAERAVCFEEILKSGDLAKILSLLKMLIIRKEQKEIKPFKTSARDEKAFNSAQKAVTEAFAYPLGLEKNQVIQYISERIKSNNK